MTFYILLGFSAFLISLLGTRLSILALRKRNLLLDHPNLRSNHRMPVPRGGGIAVVMAMIINLMIADINYGIVLALFILAAVSLLDDLIGVPAIVRLLVQIAGVSVALGLMPITLFDGYLPEWLDKLVIGVLWLWFINLFNFMDGIDGLSASEMICISVGLCLIIAVAGTFPSNLFLYGLIVAGAGCGFLWWNWHPAKIFLGDVGSIPIGFLLGYLLLLAVDAGYGIAVLILPAYYLSDSTIILFSRLWRGKKIWVAHSEHYYQKAVRSGRSHDSVARYVFGVNLLLILLATMSVLNPPLALLFLALAYMLVFMLLGFFAHSSDGHAAP